MLTLLLLVACTQPATQDSTVERRQPFDTGSGSDSDTDADTDSGTSDTDSDTDHTTELTVQTADYACSPGTRLDLDLPIARTAIVQSYLLTDDGEGHYLWFSAAGGTVVWDAAGADLDCTLTLGPAGQEVVWSGYAARVQKIRVVWVQ
jgi:hypothetical protein